MLPSRLPAVLVSVKQLAAAKSQVDKRLMSVTACRESEIFHPG